MAARAYDKASIKFRGPHAKVGVASSGNSIHLKPVAAQLSTRRRVQRRRRRTKRASGGERNRPTIFASCRSWTGTILSASTSSNRSSPGSYVDRASQSTHWTRFIPSTSSSVYILSFPSSLEFSRFTTSRSCASSAICTSLPHDTSCSSYFTNGLCFLVVVAVENVTIAERLGDDSNLL